MNNLFQAVVQKIAALPTEQQYKLLIDFMTACYGSKDAAIKKFDEIAETSSSPEEANKKLANELNADFWEQAVCFLNRDNLSGLIKGVAELEADNGSIQCYITNEAVAEQQLNNLSSMGEMIFRHLYTIQDDIPITKEIVSERIKNVIYFTKGGMAREFGVDIKTFNKWLTAVGLGDKYCLRKKLSILEYKEIFSSLFLAEQEKTLNISEHIKYYCERLSHVAYMKEELSNLTGSDYKTLKDNSEKAIPYYNTLNIFPYRIAMAVMEKMGEEPVFIPNKILKGKPLR